VFEAGENWRIIAEMQFVRDYAIYTASYSSFLLFAVIPAVDYRRHVIEQKSAQPRKTRRKKNELESR
jgi:hypothetical protein